MQQLREVFPHHSLAALQNALNTCDGSVDRAVEHLLIEGLSDAVQLQAAEDSKSIGAPTTQDRHAAPPLNATADGRRGKSAAPRSRSAVAAPPQLQPRARWGALGGSSGQRGAAAPPLRYVDPYGGGGSSGGGGGFDASASSEAFPALGGGGGDNGGGPAVARPTPRRSGSWPQIAREQQAAWRPGRASGGAASSIIATPAAAATAAAAGNSGGDDGAAARRAAAVAALSRRHAWAGADVVWAVLESCGFERDGADALLFEMGAEGEAGCSELLLDDEEEDGDDDGGDGDGSGLGDAYSRHRREARRLTRRWLAAVRRAAALRAAGDRAGARVAAAGAARLRSEAERAHAEASARIFRAANPRRREARGEIDLHGLHAREALEALRRRLELLLCGDGGGGGAAVAAAAGSGKQQQPLQPQQQLLRVIVGRGSHSRDGEASLPRVVSGWLEAEGLKHRLVGGAIEVALPRAAAWRRAC